MGTESMGLRESKKQETRQLISDHATRLFMEQGFEQTTIAEIATAARVAKKTVTNYFPRKEDLALDHHEAFTATLARAVADRAAGESPLAALRREFTAAVETCDPVAGFAGPEFARMIAESPTLSARLRELHDLREEALAETLATVAPAQAPAQATAQPPAQAPAIAPRAAAALLGAAHRLLFQRIQELTLAGEPNARIAAVVAPEATYLFDLLEAGLPARES
ncbi:TetR/AcrR family transcriptional regulator [Streptomyces sp. NPDC058583]|uniref:TetR/AcrR family transcriptional regulator n=1 Tax=unclassified Streptomyces TaxID=2593676 RepID=UPI0036610433